MVVGTTILRLGRFITPDPLGMVDGPNDYIYANNDPVNLVDLWGLCTDDSGHPFRGSPYYGNFRTPFTGMVLGAQAIVPSITKLYSLTTGILAGFATGNVEFGKNVYDVMEFGINSEHPVPRIDIPLNPEDSAE